MTVDVVFAADSTRRDKPMRDMCRTGKKTRLCLFLPCQGGTKWDRKSYVWGTVG